MQINKQRLDDVKQRIDTCYAINNIDRLDYLHIVAEDKVYPDRKNLVVRDNNSHYKIDSQAYFVFPRIFNRFHEGEFEFLELNGVWYIKDAYLVFVARIPTIDFNIMDCMLRMLDAKYYVEECNVATNDVRRNSIIANSINSGIKCNKKIYHVNFRCEPIKEEKIFVSLVIVLSGASKVMYAEFKKQLSSNLNLSLITLSDKNNTEKRYKIHSDLIHVFNITNLIKTIYNDEINFKMFSSTTIKFLYCGNDYVRNEI